MATESLFFPETEWPNYKSFHVTCVHMQLLRGAKSWKGEGEEGNSRAGLRSASGGRSSRAPARSRAALLCVNFAPERAGLPPQTSSSWEWLSYVREGYVRLIRQMD